MAAEQSVNGLGNSRLGPAERETALARMGDEEFDVVVVGGGIVGAGVALDAATRGLTVGAGRGARLRLGYVVALVQAHPRGLRYLEQLDFGLVREALTERGLLLSRIAPHLVRPVPFLFPLTHRVWERAYVGPGSRCTTGCPSPGHRRAGVPRHRHLTPYEGAAGGAVPEARLRSSAPSSTGTPRWTTPVTSRCCCAPRPAYGAQVATRTQAVGFLREGERVTGVRVRDLESERRDRGPRQAGRQRHRGLDRRDPGAGRRPRADPRRASKGMHLVVPRDRIHSACGIILRTEKSVLFVIPWGRHWIIGTTDTALGPRQGPPGGVQGGHRLRARSTSTRVLNVPLTHDDVEGVYAGLRPLLSGESDETSKLSREHVVAPRSRAGGGRGRQVHDLPGDGQGRRRRGGARP